MSIYRSAGNARWFRITVGFDMRSFQQPHCPDGHLTGLDREIHEIPDVKIHVGTSGVERTREECIDLRVGVAELARMVEVGAYPP